MSRHARTLGEAYFARMYATDPDPWRFETSDYERDKYVATLDFLPQGDFARAFEVGCSIGVLSELLARRCARLLAVDLLDEVIERARVRCRAAPHVTFQRMHFPHERPTGTFDLILLSEVAYYWTREDLAAAASALRDCAAPGGHLALVHYTGATDYPLSGDEATDAMIADLSPTFVSVRWRRASRYRMDLLVRPRP